MCARVFSDVFLLDRVFYLVFWCWISDSVPSACPPGCDFCVQVRTGIFSCDFSGWFSLASADFPTVVDGGVAVQK